MSDHNVVIIGCGPAGLAAGYELEKRGQNAICLERDNIVGGISRTTERNGFRFDIGGHRFFTKIARVDELWHEVLTSDFLRRPRLSRIYYNHKFFNYPLKLANALLGLGLINSVGILASFVASKIHPFPQEDTFEQWVSNRFGKRLFQIFFKTYTEKVWGIPCNQIGAEWAAQRIKGLSLGSAVKTALFGDKQKKIKTLIQEFDYPRFGPGGNSKTIEGTDFLSSMPVNELAMAIVPRAEDSVLDAAGKLSYRSLLTVNLMMNRKESFPDTWIYIHSPRVKVGRVQCFKNWSPFMVPDENTSSLGLEYFCTEGDDVWESCDEELIELAKREIKELGLAEPSSVFDAFVARMPKTYPVYQAGYREHLRVIKNYLAGFENLQCIGRNGMFKYNNMDHSILSALLAVENIFGADNDLWSVNVEEEYHEQARS